MKSKRKEGKCGEEPKFPRLMEGKDSGVLVLFTKPKIGTVVDKADCGKDLGQHYDGWHMPQFKPFEGCICLEND